MSKDEALDAAPRDIRRLHSAFREMREEYEQEKEALLHSAERKVEAKMARSFISHYCEHCQKGNDSCKQCPMHLADRMFQDIEG